MAGFDMKIDAKKAVGCIFAIMATMMVSAFAHSDTTLASESFRSIFMGVIYVLLLMAFVISIPLINLKNINMNIALLIGVVIIFTILNVFHSYETASVGILLIAQWVLFCLLPSDAKKYSFKVFMKVWFIICLVGIFCFLFYILKVPVPYQEVPYYFSGNSLKYINYGLSFLYQNSDMVRLCGLCNEPGYLGTFCALILCVDRMNLKKFSNIVIFMAGLLTFSAAFYMIVIIYSALKVITAAHENKNMKKKILYYSGVALVLLSYFIILPNIQTGDIAIDKTLQRLTITSEGLSGDNRTTAEFDALYDSVMASNPLFGMGNGYVSKTTSGGSLSYKVKIVNYGIIGCLLLWGTLLMAALYKNTKNKEVVLFVIVFFASIYQRPNVISLPYLVLLVGGIEYIKKYAPQSRERKLEE